MFDGALAGFARTVVVDETRPVFPLTDLLRDEFLERLLLKVYGPELVKEQLRKQLGPNFRVQDSDEQHVSLFKAIKVEKLFVFITFTLILLIASLNIFFSLSMLVIDKKKDISVLLAMGASQKAVRRTFLYVGAIVALVGATVGLVVGVGLCWLQQRFGFVSMGMATSVVDAYPVKIQASDLIFTCLSIIFITLAVSIRPALNASHLDLRENL